MGTAAEFIAEARKSLGTKETPPGSNKNYIVAWYNKNVEAIGAGPWCDMAVTMWGALSDTPTVGEFAYTVWHAEWFKKNSRWFYGTAGIKAGDVIFFDWTRLRSINKIDHVGIVERVENGLFYTIEGNSGNECVREVRDSKYVVGYGRPVFKLAKLTAPSGKPMLERGSEGTRVVQLQKCLNAVMKANLVPDGKYGTKTTGAVEDFQVKYKITKDGQYGTESARTLAKALKAVS